VAREVIERLIDDLDGSEASETVTFGFDGTTYEIRPEQEERRRVSQDPRAVLQGRQENRSGRREAQGCAAQPSRRTRPDYDITPLREWAGRNGVAVPARGRIPRAVVDQYKAAGGG
jgi:nucleoid-associated protein Lsr2